MCARVWKTRDDFLRDKSLEINGYGAYFDQLEKSLFYFTHNIEGCRSTLTVSAENFFSLYSGKKYKDRRTREKDCPGYCLDKEQLDRCDAFCECAFNREIIQVIKKNYRQ